jgi:predicted Zn-dependent protease
MKAARWICAALALVACAWFAFGIRQAIDTSRATAIANRGNHVTATQVHQVSSLAAGARLLNPDKQPDVLLGQTEFEHGDSAAARGVLEPVTRSEPQNVTAWLWLARASHGDAATFYEAALRVQQLEPRFPPP